MSCKCKTGLTEIDFLTLIPGGTSASSSYLLSLTHYNCGGKRTCVNTTFPPTANLSYRVLGEPLSLGNDNYCCKLIVTGTVTYLPLAGCDCCNVCPVTDNVYFTVCVPCSSNVAPTITAGTVTATPKSMADCCTTTDTIELTTSFLVATT